MAKKKSVLDLVLNDAKSLLNKVSGNDKIMLEQHFDEIRAIERTLQANGGASPKLNAAPASPGPSCSKPAAPDMTKMPLAPGGDNFPGGWSNEDLRGNVMADMLCYALACDLTRTASWMLTNTQTFMGTGTITPGRTGHSQAETEFHDDSHFASNAICQENANFLIGMYARVVQKLKSMPDVSGSVLDNTVVAMVWDEGANAHDDTDMTMLIAGLPSELKNGLYLSGAGMHSAAGLANSTGAHPAEVHVATMRALGIEDSSGLVKGLGQVSGCFNPLLVNANKKL